MIKTLRITSILAAVLATVLVGFFVFRIARGIRGNKNVKEFLDSPDVIEKFKAAEGDRTNTSAGQISPLVKQAQAFALYLNPPAPKRGTSKPIPGGGSISSKINVTPKFKVIGTSLYENRPEMSMALIDEPGKGIHWVKQSTTVGHLFIEQVQNDLVIVKSGTETFNLVLERDKTESKSQATGKSSVPKKPAGATGSSASRAISSSRNRNVIKRVPTKSLPPKQDTAKKEELEKLYEDLRDLKNNTDMNDSSLSEEERAKQIGKIISSFKASYVSEEEAKKLDDLAEKLKEDESEPNTTDIEEELPIK